MKVLQALKPLGFVLIFLVLLYFLPEALTRRHFRLTESSPPSTVGTFPIDASLPIIWSDGKPASGKLTFSELLNGRSDIMVNFWATWCPPCVEELPSLELLNRELAQTKLPRALKLILVSVDENPAIVRKFLEKVNFKTSVLVLHDPGGKLSQSLGTTRFPETFWVQPKGLVRYKWVGPQNWLSKDNILRLTS